MDSTPPVVLDDEAGTEEPAPNPRKTLIVIAISIAAVILLVTQYLLITTLFNTQSELSGVLDELQDLTESVGDVQTDVDSVQEGLGTVEDSLNEVEGGLAGVDDRVRALQESPLGFAAGPLSGADEASEAPETEIVVSRALPRFGGNPGADPAVGMDVGVLAGLEYYSGERVTYEPDSGLARAILIWAHWCPYCQQEMPTISDGYVEWSEEYPNVELVSITTAMDPSRGNPLGAYLEDGQFPFPVIVDADGSLSTHLGVNAFPFWVFTGPDGTVLARTAGLLPEGNLTDILRQLNEIAASA